MPLWVLIVYALATARLTGLITADEITRPTRDAILSRLNSRSRLHRRFATLISCQWCASIWIAAAVAPLAWWHATNPWFAMPAVGLAFSQATGILSNLGRE